MHFKQKLLRSYLKLKSKYNNYKTLDDINEIDFEAQDIPKLPIKTYRWEDVKRSRRKGAYPWTHLNKPQFDEEIDQEEYTMDAFRRSRSTSTLGKSDNQDFLNNEFELKEEIPQDNLEKPFKAEESNENCASKLEASGSKDTVNIGSTPLARIENKDTVRSKSAEPRHKRKISIESGKSGASLSKLGIMDKFKSTKNKLLKRSKSDASDSKKIKKASNEKNVVAKTTKSKLATVKDESPVYIHIPLKLPEGQTDEFSKFEFESPGPSSHSASLTKLQNVGTGQRKMSLMGILAELKKVQAEQQKQKLAAKAAVTEEHNKDSPVDNLNELNVPQKPSDITEIRENAHASEPTIELLDSTDSAITNDIKENKLNIEEILDTDIASTSIKYINSELENDKSFDPVVNEPDENSDDDNISQYLDKDDNYEQISEKSTNISSENLSKVEEINKQSKQSLQLSETKAASTNTSETALSKWKQLTPSTTKLEIPKTRPSQRAKSEEPKRKRRSSIDSGHSRKSLSRVALAKRFKEATDKIKLPKLPSFAKLNKKPKSKSTENVKKKTASDSALTKTHHVRQYPETPLYIHIPLKPPPGTTDEFSSLEEKTVETVHEKSPPEVKEKLTGQISIESSDTTDANIQFIYLTAPSDDELLDSNIPETPSESDQKFFENMKEDDLKVLAKSAMSKVCPENVKLETVTEDEGNGQHNISAVLKLQILAKNALEVEQSPKETLCKIEEIVNAIPVKTEEPIEQVVKPISVETEKAVEELIKPPQVPYQINKQTFIDEEDGLKLSDAAIAMINEEMAKEFNQETELLSNTKSESSPGVKKKVSFKRTSADNGDSIYEDLELNPPLVKDNIEQESASSPIKGKKLETFQSMSVEEQKSYLDQEALRASSLDEDYNKWSPLNDHEYEPVNPPPEDIPLPKLSMQPLDTEGPSKHDVEFSSKEAENENTSKENVNAQDVQNMMEEYFVKTPPKTLTPILKETIKPPQLPKEETIPSKKEPTQSKSFNDALKNQAGKIKTKLQKFKNASIKLPPPPKFPSTKLKKPNFTMPKMPQRPSLASLGIVRKNSRKDSWKERQFSTESNVSSSAGNIFDFRTFPRIFKKNKRKESPSPSNRDVTPPPAEFATVPRMSKKKNMDSSWARENQGKDSRKSKEYYKNETKDVIRIPLHSEDDDSIDVPSHAQYREDIDDIDDDYDRENINRDSPFSKDYLKRWDHGEFHENPQLRYVNESDSNDFNIHNYNNDMEEPNTLSKEQYDNEIDLTSGKEEHSSGSLNERRQGVLEEIDSDEFFLREKGISQENIEVGKYLSSEIREAFRNPTNALSQFQSEDRDYDLEASDQSEPSQNVSKRKPLRKPKRKKTPHVSREQISFDQDSVTTEPDEYLKGMDTFNVNDTPTRPKRKSNKKKKNKPATEDVIPYQETIPIDKSYEYPIQDDEMFNNKSVFLHHTISDSELQGFYENELQQQMYENEFMQGIEQPEIKVSDFYNKYENFQEFQKDISDFFKEDKTDETPIAPKRKQRSLKSLTVSLPETNIEMEEALRLPQNEVEVYRSEEYIIPTPEPPKRSRKRRSRTRSPSVISVGDESISRREESLTFETPMEKVTQPVKISRKHRSRTHSPSTISQQTDDRISNCEEIRVLDALPQPVEEPTKPKRRSRTHSPSIITQQEDDRISCDEESLILDVPTPAVEEVCVQNLCDHMGYAVINKSRKPEPPLPPPRFPATPPARRKRKNKQKNLEQTKFSTVPRSVNDDVPLRPLRNYSTLGGTNTFQRSRTSLQQDEEKENIDVRQYSEIDNEEPVKRLQSGEVIKKMKDRPLPAPPRPPRKSKEFREVFRDISHERNILTESQTDLDKISTNEVQMESEIDHDDQITDHLVDAVLSNIENEILPYDHEETVTHGSLVIQPLNNAQILPLHELSQNRNNSGNEIVRIIPIDQNLPTEIINDNELIDEDETSYIPEEFKQLRNPEEEEKTRVQTNDFQDYDETSEIPEEFKQLKDPEEIPAQTKIKKSEDYDVTTEVPEEFTKLKIPQSKNQIDSSASTIAPSKDDSQNLGILKAEKLQVQNLDVDKLRVNELQATKIIVSELDGVSLQVKEINSKSGNLVISGIELPPQLINQMLDQLQAAAHTSFQRSSSPQKDSSTAQTGQQENNTDQPIISNKSDVKCEEEKDPCESASSKTENTAEAPPVPPRYDSKADLLDDNLINIINFESESSKLHQVVQHQDSQEQVDSNQQEPDECYSIENPPTRPPRKSSQIIQNIEDCLELPINLTSNIALAELSDNSRQSEVIQEEIVFTFPPTQKSLNSLVHTDSSKSEEEPPPRPPQPISQEAEYVQSQPPLSFYNLRSPQFIEFIEDIPLPPRRKRHHKSVPRSKSSSDDSVLIQRRHRRSSEPSIPRLTGQLVRACTTEMERSIKRLISHFRNNVLQNADGQQDSHIMILILLILIAGLILLSCDEKINIHHHHWEYFNPPKDL